MIEPRISITHLPAQRPWPSPAEPWAAIFGAALFHLQRRPADFLLRRPGPEQRRRSLGRHHLGRGRGARLATASGRPRPTPEAGDDAGESAKVGVERMRRFPTKSYRAVRGCGADAAPSLPHRRRGAACLVRLPALRASLPMAGLTSNTPQPTAITVHGQVARARGRFQQTARPSASSSS